MYESRRKAPLSPAQFRHRVFVHMSFVTGLLSISLFGGMLGYHVLAHMEWTDAFVNAAMLLGGMGPVGPDLPDAAAKIFAGCYALYCGLVFIAAGGLLLAPFVHRVMHKLHWEDKD